MGQPLGTCGAADARGTLALTLLLPTLRWKDAQWDMETGRTVEGRGFPFIAKTAMNEARGYWGEGRHRSGRFTGWDEWGKEGVDLCEIAHILLAKPGLKLVRL